MLGDLHTGHGLSPWCMLQRLMAHCIMPSTLQRKRHILHEHDRCHRHCNVHLRMVTVRLHLCFDVSRCFKYSLHMRHRLQLQLSTWYV